MPSLSRPLIILLLLILAGWHIPAAGVTDHDGRLDVVVSVKPLHSLVAGVMRGVAMPTLLIKGGASPHHYNLRPSEVRRLQNAQVVFWFGGNLETFLVKSLAGLRHAKTVVSLLDTPGLLHLPLGGQHKAHSPALTQDPHIWLDPRNAVVLVKRIAAVLTRLDPGHQMHYQQNALQLVDRIEHLDQDLKSSLMPYQNIAILSWHDAYQYFAHRYGLNVIGVVTASSDRQPGARRLREVYQLIERLKITCLFSGPQFDSALLSTISRDTGIQRGVMDPLAATLAPGEEAYFQILTNMRDELLVCMKRKQNF